LFWYWLVGRIMSYSRYLCLSAYSCVQHILFRLFFLLCTLCCQFLSMFVCPFGIFMLVTFWSVSYIDVTLYIQQWAVVCCWIYRKYTWTSIITVLNRSTSQQIHKKTWTINCCVWNPCCIRTLYVYYHDNNYRRRH
jgi:hypothetical protein